MSDPTRLTEVTRRISSVKQRTYPIVVGRDAPYRIEERPWSEVPEPSKLAILQDMNWSGVSNRDRAHILLTEVDAGKISDHQRNRLIDMAIDVPRGAASLDSLDKPLTPMQVKALHAEIRTDEHAARVRDHGPADAATYDDRMVAAYRFREQALGPSSPDPLPVTPAELERHVDDLVRRMAGENLIRPAPQRGRRTHTEQ